MNAVSGGGDALVWWSLTRAFVVDAVAEHLMNTLLRPLTAKGRELGISHDLDGVDQFNNMAFADDLSLFAQSTGDIVLGRSYLMKCRSLKYGVVSK